MSTTQTHLGHHNQGAGQTSGPSQAEIPYHPSRRSAHTILDEERLTATFNSRELTHFLNGGPEATLEREQNMVSLERDSDWRLEDFPSLSLERKRERTMRKFRTLMHWLVNENIERFDRRFRLISVVDPAFWTRAGVHLGLFFGAIQGQGTAEQLGFWTGKGALACNGVIGCYGMTELGHGSNVAGVETTATYDAVSDEFIIHTPTLTATKWWIGGAAHTATHCAVVAQLVVNGKRHGPKTFIVPLRDAASYQTLPGVAIGDIGKKMGRDGIDNGWIQFTSVRIPRSFMLMKHTKVSRDGKVTAPPLEQLTYGPLIKGRVSMFVDSGMALMKALSIAVRYSCVRRQFARPDMEVETKLLDYVIHQHRLLPLVAQAFAAHFAGLSLLTMYTDLMGEMEVTKPGADMTTLLDKLKETHATSAGLKAFGTWGTLEGIDTCRQACGGHGYSSYVGLADMYSDFAVQCTWEGDNTILALQTGRYLVSCYRDAIVKGKILVSSGVEYLNHMKELKSKRCGADVTDLDMIAWGWDAVAARAVETAGKIFLASMEGSQDMDDALEACAAERKQAARMHCLRYQFRSFYTNLQRDPPAHLKDILTKLCKLYGLYGIYGNSGMFLQCGFMDASQVDQVYTEVTKLCSVLRPEAVSLTDSFGFTDYVINSPFGRYDGNVYETYFALVASQNPPGQIPPYFESTIKPLLNRAMDVQEAPELE